MELSGPRDGAHWDARPVVPWAQLTMGKPPGGGAPPGTTITPETATSLPAIDSEWYRIRYAVAPGGSCPADGITLHRMIEPGGAGLSVVGTL